MPSVECLYVSQNTQQVVFHNDDQFIRYDWEENFKVVNLSKNPNFPYLMFVSNKCLLVSCHHLRLLFH